MTNQFGGCSVWALAPFLLFLVSCCLLRCFLGRNASLAGGFAGRRVWFVLVVVCFSYRFACSNGHDLSLYKCLSSLCSCKDRAFSATSATLEEKKSDPPKGTGRRSKKKHLSPRPTLKMGRGNLKHTSIPHLWICNCKSGVWKRNRRFPLRRHPWENGFWDSTGTVNLNTTSRF